jgi:predicted NBD/HSP70 family sugar kinase
MVKKPLHSHDIRERNEKLVLNLIYTHRGISQSNVVQLTGLKPPTIFRIFSKLEQEAYIAAGAADKALPDRKGRKPVYYSVRPDALYTAGVDFWSRSAAVVIVDFSGAVVAQDVVELPAGVDAPHVLDRLTALIESSLRSSAVPREKLLGIGIGSPGVVDIERGMVLHYSRIQGMRDFDLKHRLEERFQVPVHVHNNCAVIALSEHRYGKAQGVHSLLAILIRSGVGGAFIQDGSLYVNRNRTALEIGHLALSAEGPACECGQRGCLESYLCEDALLESIGGRTAVRTIQDLGAQLQAGNPRVLAALDAKARILAQAIQNLANILDPQAFLLVSRSFAVSSHLAAVAGEILRGREYAKSSPVRIIPDEYSPILAGRGATDLVFDHFFSH